LVLRLPVELSLAVLVVIETGDIGDIALASSCMFSGELLWLPVPVGFEPKAQDVSHSSTLPYFFIRFLPAGF
jgi:hypothetical protein